MLESHIYRLSRFFSPYLIQFVDSRDWSRASKQHGKQAWHRVGQPLYHTHHTAVTLFSSVTIRLRY